MIPKFRAFYKPNKKMYEVLTLDIIDEKVLIENTDNPDKPLKGYAKWEEMELMQSTGLKDKNGKEIFEGDIVREFGNDYTPIYTKGIYMALKIEQLKLDKNMWDYSTQFNVVWMNGCEIIGNIYDNPELMEE